MKIYLNDFSNAPLRVRIAVALKRLRLEEVHVPFVDSGAGRQSSELGGLNPQHMLPVLVDGNHIISQSLAIIEYLEEKEPIPALLPADPPGRARVRSLALMIACDGQPLLNRRVRKYLSGEMTARQAAKWFDHWMHLSLQEYESSLVRDAVPGRYSHGDSPTLADLCLVPQILMAQRFDVQTAQYRRAMQVFQACMELPEFAGVAQHHRCAQRHAARLP